VRLYNTQSLQFIYFSMLYRKQNSIEFHENKIRDEHPNVIPVTFLEGSITLVPKVRNVETISVFRAIYLLNTVHAVMASLIGRGQSACILGVSCIEI
jgi:hypothetical protein